MAEVQSGPAEASSAPRDGHRGRGRRGWRGGRGSRGGRGGRGGMTPSLSVEDTRPQADSRPEDVPGAAAASTEAASTAGSQGGPQRGSRGSRGGRARGDGGRRGRGTGRGGHGAAQHSNVVSQRAFGGHLTSGSGGTQEEAGSGLSAAAPDFVPGQPVTTAKPAVSAQSNGGAIAQQRQPTTHLVHRRDSKSSAQDLPTRIHEDIDNGQYECVICTSEVVRTSRIWSCTICWTVAHLHCVKKWHKNQIQNQEANPPQPNQTPGWRCPGCNSPLQDEPGAYQCWCGKEMNPKPIAGLSPHSCGQTCSKRRPTCPHPCSLTCHAGPCPPCTLMGPTQTCYCGKNITTKRCVDTEYGKGWSCHEICGDLLPCGEHTCSQECHSGLCGGCEIPIPSICYCGKERKDIACDQRDTPHESYNHGQLIPPAEDSSEPLPSWFEGCYKCTNPCIRPFDCGIHVCEQPCHPQDESPSHCPLSPDVVTRCPCGKSLLHDISPSPRTFCQDPIPHCSKPCSKPLSCGHLCPDKCHVGPCRPCGQTIDITCRCGRTAVQTACHQGSVQQPLCFRICRAQLNCGRHECGEHCCPGERKATERRKQKKTANDNFEAEHICLQPCGRTLRCGEHACQQLCHRGACPSCLDAVFDEIACSCGRTVLQPPQPCGTRPPECRFACTRVPRCGHPVVEHQCHPDDVACPKCPFLVEKPCICGKKTLKNQPCWFDEARCGLPCGKKLRCGAHECRKPCHRPGECEDVGIGGSHCGQVCGKTRTSCDHACAEVCHAPYPCREERPCQCKTFVTCPCQNRKTEVRCGASWGNPMGEREMLKCDEECGRLLRNRRLAEALRIDPDTHTDDHVPYSETTMKLYRENTAWAMQQEREFRVFADEAGEKRVRFKPMPGHQRAFLHALADDYGLDSESQDPEPHRHVVVFKTPRFVSAPRKTLAQCLRLVARPTVQQAAAAAPAVKIAEQGLHFNALLLAAPKFGLTCDELESALAGVLATAKKVNPPVGFAIAFVGEEVLVRASAAVTAAAVATSAATPAAVEGVLKTLKPAVVKRVAALGLAGSVSLCRVDGAGVVVRREGGDGPGVGWSAVASRGGWRKGGGMAAAAPVKEEKKGFGFVALRKLGEGKKKADDKEKQKEKEVVEDDWLAAAEKMDGGEEKEDVMQSGEAAGDALPPVVAEGGQEAPV